MLHHILTTFYRTILRSKFQVLTVITGLSIGITVSLLIYIYVKEETSFDKHHANAERIFRVNDILEMEGKVDNTAKSAYNTGDALMEFFPEIESSTQVMNVGKQTIRIGDNMYASEQVIYADSNYFTFFTHQMLQGNPATALDGPNKAVIAKSVADAYFGSAGKAIDNTMEVNNKNFQVTGVYDDRSYRTHIPHKIFLSIASQTPEFLAQRNREFMWITCYTYIQFREGTDIDVFRGKMKAFNEKYLIPYVQKNQVNGAITFEFEPVTNIHLDDKLRFDFPGAINPDYLRIFSVIAVLTLLIALINYVNLTTAKVSRRIKEIGIKKSVGATRRSLITQFIIETIITVLVSYIIALGLFGLALPELNRLTEKNLQLQEVFNLNFFIGSLAFLAGFGILAGVYPAILLSAFKPVDALRSGIKTPGATIREKLLSPAMIRKVLVMAQFSISIFLVIGTIIIFKQFDYLRSESLGFDQKQVMVIDIPNDTAVSNKIDVIRNKLLQIPSVKSVSSTNSIPGSNHGALTMNVSQSGGSEIKIINTYFSDDQFMKTLDIELKEGRFFSREFSTDPQEAFVVNEAAVKFLGWKDPVGKLIESPLGQKGQVVGVIKDFNYKSLHTAIEPLVFMNQLTSQGFLLVKLETDDFASVTQQVSDAWKAFDRSHPYEYFFLDEKFQLQYIKEQRLANIFTYFASLAIFISCLGLIGLAIFTNELKVKEVGIRKTLGASDAQIFGLLSSNFLMLILLANLIAWPLSYYFISEWLKNFAYKTTLNIFPFLLGSVISFLIAFVTIGYFAWKATRQDVVRALKYE
jgi:putative ABC transport system permease protein